HGRRHKRDRREHGGESGHGSHGWHLLPTLPLQPRPERAGARREAQMEQPRCQPGSGRRGLPRRPFARCRRRDGPRHVGATTALVRAVDTRCPEWAVPTGPRCSMAVPMETRGRARLWRAPGRLALAAAMGLASLLPMGARASQDEPPPADPTSAPDASVQTVRPGAVVHLEFTMRDGNGEVLERSDERAPLVFTVGAGQVVPGLERARSGLAEGEARRITVAPEEAYGAWDPAAVTEVPKDRLPAEARTIGARVRARTRSGREVWARVREVGEE